jgi:hypothetical protein
LEVVTEHGESTLWIADKNIEIRPPRISFTQSDVTANQWHLSEDGLFIARCGSERCEVWSHDGAGLGHLWERNGMQDVFFFKRESATYLRTTNRMGEIRDRLVFEEFKNKPDWAKYVSMAIDGRTATDNGLSVEFNDELLRGPVRAAFFRALSEDSSQSAQMLRRYYGLRP